MLLLGIKRVRTSMTQSTSRGMAMSAPASAISRFMTRAISILRGRKGDDYTIGIHPDGIELKWISMEGRKGERNIRWDEIVSVKAYKRDLATSDIICILCTFSDDIQFEFNEGMTCWQNMVDALSEHLPGFPTFSEWWNQVAVPAFSTNEKVLFQRVENDRPSESGSSI